jgi:hypothetical protein
MKWFSMMVLLLVIGLTGCRATRDGDFHTSSGAASVDAQRYVAASCQEASLRGQMAGLRDSGLSREEQAYQRKVLSDKAQEFARLKQLHRRRMQQSQQMASTAIANSLQHPPYPCGDYCGEYQQERAERPR